MTDTVDLDVLGAMLRQGIGVREREPQWSSRVAGASLVLIWVDADRELTLESLVGSFPAQPVRAARQIATAAAALRCPEDQLLGERLRRHSASALTQLVEGGLSWALAVRLAEALALATAEDARAGDPGATANLPLIRRARFLTLSLPWRAKPGAHTGPGPGPVLGEPLGGNGRELVERARTAREDWVVTLLNHDDHPVLAGWRDEDLDREMRRVLFTGRDGGGSPLQLQSAATGPDNDTTITAVACREWFLPRFMLGDVRRALRQEPRRTRVAAVSPFFPLGAVTAITMFGLLVRLPRLVMVQAMIVLSLLAYLLVVGVVGSRPLRRPVAGYLACPRLAASAAVGSLALLSLDGHWVSTPRGRWLGATVLLVGAAYGYLVVEARSHGAAAAWARAAVVAAIAFAHAVAVAVLFLQVIAPALNLSVATAVASLSPPGLSRLYLLAAATGLAAGVFLQLLWNDQPVTYPLSHFRWRGRGTP